MISDPAQPGSAGGHAAPLVLRPPRAEDAVAVHDLIVASPPLDRNSLYANLLQCTHFSATCLVAERGGEITGWVSGYRPPSDPAAYFLWQIATAVSARGQGLGRRLVHAVLAAEAVRDAERLLTTITEANEASWALFRGVAKDLGASIRRRTWLERRRHFADRHDSELLVTIEPLPGGDGHRRAR
jgi:L-2,4-diaminobutyric acid acetyltransferase